MIYFNFSVGTGKFFMSNGSNFFHKVPFDRTLELTVGKISNNILSTEVSLVLSGSDHAGPRISASIFGYGFKLELPKNRHWNYDKDCWLENYDSWMNQAIELSRQKDDTMEYYPYMFSEYYESGMSPEEAIEALFSEEFEDDD